ncbi:hypothetical protein LOD99_15252 [Oopsacas minuta]|uniref:PARP catalytic domain-containing protein n=1 Tax=Oopsacas minuta TaxID=111878 RepID=A0AAV7KBA9_9METZ|nr:hypothetical protein LOD99_15252 [Oopsacas minuta]
MGGLFSTPQGTKCKDCDVVLDVPVNKDNLCTNCLQNRSLPICTKCKVNNSNPGFNWCQSCYASYDKCTKCYKNKPNKGFKWCETCFQAKLSNAVSRPEKCFCGKDKFFNSDQNRWLDFCGNACAERHYAAFGVLKLDENHPDFVSACTQFKNNWNLNKGACPPVTAIFRVQPRGADVMFDSYKNALTENANTEYYFHGCKIKCDLLKSNSLCNLPECTICQVSKQSFDIKKVGTNVKFTRFGKGLYFAPESSKCHDYTLGDASYGYRAMFYVKCAPGKKQIEYKDDINRVSPDAGYNSIYGKAGVNLNYDELCLYTDKACIPDCIIIYSRDGVNRRCF